MSESDETVGRAMTSGRNLSQDRPVARPVEGHPIGNGRMGTLVWTTPDAVEFQINRVDVFAVNRHHQGMGQCEGGAVDYGGGCAQVRVAVGGGALRRSPCFRQCLSLEDARCSILGEGVRIECWVAAENDVLVVEVTDERDAPCSVTVELAVWSEPEVRLAAHTAAHAFAELAGGMAVVRSFREGDHYCSSAVAAACPSACGAWEVPDERARVLRLPAERGTRAILIASAASMDEAEDVGGAAGRTLLALARPGELETVRERHERWWRMFWTRTFARVESPDGHGERAARDRELFLYHMACTSRGPYPPKWNGSIFLTDGDARAWGAQFWLWTTEVLYWPLHAADVGELSETWFGMYRRQLRSLEAAARQRWSAAGIFLPEVVPFDGPPELPEDTVAEYRSIFLGAKPNTEASRRLAAACAYDHHLMVLLHPVATESGGYAHASHLASSGAELAVHAWWRYRYSGDVRWLRMHAYPLLRGVAEFYRSLARRDEDGLWHIHATNAHEDFWGVTDSIFDLAAIRGTVPLAILASEILSLDAELRGPWRALLDELAPYPMGADPRARALTGGSESSGSALADDAWAAGYLGAVDGSHNPEDVQLAPIFPFEDWTLETRDTDAYAVAQRTVGCAPRHRRVLNGEGLNTAIRSPIAAVRAGLGPELPRILDRYRAAFDALPNGFSLFEQVRPGQAHSIEHLGLLTMVLQEALLQSVSPRPGEPEIISVFPAWPREWDAEFRLLARGGFLVHARHTTGVVEFVEVHSRRGEACRLRNPWRTRCSVEQAGEPARELDGEVLEFDTAPGATYRVLPIR